MKQMVVVCKLSHNRDFVNVNPSQSKKVSSTIAMQRIQRVLSNTHTNTNLGKK